MSIDPDTPNTDARSDDAPRVLRVVSCINCWSPLAGLPLAGKCPGCATPVQYSLVGDRLELASKAHLVKLRRGLGLMVWTTPIWAVATILHFVFAANAESGSNAIPSVVAAAVVVATSLLFTGGFWMFTSADREGTGSKELRFSRRFSRAAVLVGLGVILFFYTVATGNVLVATGTFTPVHEDSPRTLAELVRIGFAVRGASEFIAAVAMIGYVRLLGRRVPDEQIESRCRVFVFLLPVLAVVTPAGAAALLWPVLRRLYTHITSISRTGHVATELGARIMPAAAPAQSPEVLQATAACISCGYPMAGLPLSGMCPECGVAVLDSLRGDRLEFAGRGYLLHLRRGIIVVIVGSSVSTALYFLRFRSVMGISAFGAPLDLSEFLTAIGQTVVALVTLWGYWMFTTPDPAAARTDEQRSARRLARTCVIIGAVATTVSMLATAATLFGRPAGSTNAAQAFDTAVGFLSFCTSVGAFIAWIVQMVAILRYTRLLARRVPDAVIERRTKTYLWRLPLLFTVGFLFCGLGPLIAVAMYCLLLNRLRVHVSAILSTGKPAPLPFMR